MAVIRNLENGRRLCEHFSIADTSLSRALGFMFRRPCNHTLVFLFPAPVRVCLHMWFVFGAIDVLILDSGGRVAALKSRFRPWTVWCPGVRASVIIELPVGTIARTGTRLGHRIAVPLPGARASSSHSV